MERKFDENFSLPGEDELGNLNFASGIDTDSERDLATTTVE